MNTQFPEHEKTVFRPPVRRSGRSRAPRPARRAGAAGRRCSTWSSSTASPQPTAPEETAQIAKTTAALKQALDQSGLYRAIDLAPIAKDIDAVRDVTNCDAFEVALAKKAGARVAVVAWVQKVSNLILNMNIRIVDARTGATLKGGSVDIRGNDERSWDRGLKILLEEHVFAPPR